MTLQNVLLSNLSMDSLKKIKGICLRDENNIPFLTEAERIVPQELLENDMPGIAYDLMPSMDSYRTSSWHSNYLDENRSPFASIYTSLGCIYKCEFCMINIINRTNNNENLTAKDFFSKFRYWSPEFTIKQLDYLADKGVKQIKIADEMWVLKPKHFENLCDLLIERNYGFNIWAYTRIDTIKPKYLKN